MYDGLKNLQVPRRTRARRAAKVSVAGLTVAGLLFASFGIYAFQHVNHKIRKAQRDYKGLAESVPGEPLNILVIGSDRRDVVEPSLRKRREFKGGGGQRTDTIILLHVAAEAEKAVLVSFPRDLYVDVPGRGMGRINSAYAFGGPELLIKTVKQVSGLSIHHYLELNFQSFRQIVDAVGGVSLYFPKPVRDKKAGLEITEAGCVELDGADALAFVRARAIYASADIGRIQAQQRFIRALISKVRSAGTILNPGKVLKVADAIGGGLRVDRRTNLGLALGIARKLSDQNKIDFRIFPGSTRPRSPYVFPNREEARALFTAIGNDAPLPEYGKTQQSLPDPSDVTVSIFNATGENGIAARERSRLVEFGYVVRSIGTAKTKSAETTVTYAPGAQLKAELLRKHFPSAQIEPAGNGQATDLVVTVGTESLGTDGGAGPSKSPQRSKSSPSKKPTFASLCG